MRLAFLFALLLVAGCDAAGSNTAGSYAVMFENASVSEFTQATLAFDRPAEGETTVGTYRHIGGRRLATTERGVRRGHYARDDGRGAAGEVAAAARDGGAVSGRVVQVSVSPRGGVPKLPVEAAEVGTAGLAGDAVRYTKIHGGPERAVCLFSAEIIARLQAEGHPVAPGTTGENLTLAGLDWADLEAGDVLAVGAAVQLQLTARVEPCKTIQASFKDGAFKRIQPAAHPAETRWYTRVLSGGMVRPGDSVERLGVPA